MSEHKSGANIQIIAAIIGATAVCIAAVIGILQPFVSRWVDNNFPTNTPLASVGAIPETSIPILTAPNVPAVPVTSLPFMPSSVTVTPSPTLATPLSKYEFVSLQNVGTYESGNLGLQAGKQTLDNVDFQIGWLVTTQSQDKPNNPDIITLDVQQNSSQISKVHFLLQAGWALTPNKEIGTITLIFADGRRLDESLKTGYNIRDWSEVNVPLTSPNVQQAWKGVAWDGKTQGVVDMLTISISSDYGQTRLAQIEIKDKSMENFNLLNPEIHLWAITMER